MKSSTILLVPLNGDINACFIVGKVLRNSGHRIVFAIDERRSGQLKKYGFEEQLIYGHQTNSDQSLYNSFYFRLKFRSTSTDQKFVERFQTEFNEMLSNSRKLNPIMDEIVKQVNPQLIIIDSDIMIPSLINRRIPWVRIWTENPLTLYGYNPSLQPPGFGLASSGDRKEWQKIRDELKLIFADSIAEYNDWLVSENCEPLPENTNFYSSPYLNIYGYPEEIDYTDAATLPANFQRIDCFISPERDEHSIEIPLKLKPKPGKLVYVSICYNGFVDVNLMKRLVTMLSKSQHRFIISKGLLSNRYELAHNMWGRKTLPQTKLLPLVDLVITSGENNTITETLYFGKPMIVMPLFAEHYDNAQRILETGFGTSLDPYKCTETELLESIENMLNNIKIEIKLKKVSQTMQRSNNISKIVGLIETIIKAKME